jgi:hypothetical protein
VGQVIFRLKGEKVDVELVKKVMIAIPATYYIKKDLQLRTLSRTLRIRNYAQDFYLMKLLKFDLEWFIGYKKEVLSRNYTILYMDSRTVIYINLFVHVYK